MALLDSSLGGASRSINFEDVVEAPESAAAESPRVQTEAEVLETLAREANGAVLWFCELATVAAVALGLTMVFEVSVWKQFVAATSATLFMTVAACVGAYVLMLRDDGRRDRSEFPPVNRQGRGRKRGWTGGATARRLRSIARVL